MVELAGVAQLDDRLLLVPFGERDSVAQRSDGDQVRAAAERFLVAFERGVAGDAGAFQLVDQGDGDAVAFFSAVAF